MNYPSQSTFENNSIAVAVKSSSDTTCCNKTNDTRGKIVLPNNFVPGDKDVILGRGKKCYNHLGNQNLRCIVSSLLDEYSTSTCKHDKSYTLSVVLASIRDNQGGFVKKDPKTGQWYDVGDLIAREKISQAFRDALCDNYKSSTVFKRKRRQERRKRVNMLSSSHTTAEFCSAPPSKPDQAMYEKLVDWSDNSSSLLSPNLTEVFDFPSSLDELAEVTETPSSSSSSSLSLLPIEDDDDPLEPIPISQAPMVEDFTFGSFNVTAVDPLEIFSWKDYALEPIPIPFQKNNHVEPMKFPDLNRTGPIALSNINVARSA